MIGSNLSGREVEAGHEWFVSGSGLSAAEPCRQGMVRILALAAGREFAFVYWLSSLPHWSLDASSEWLYSAAKAEILDCFYDTVPLRSNRVLIRTRTNGEICSKLCETAKPSLFVGISGTSVGDAFMHDCLLRTLPAS
jgi:hypothetical protein